MPAVVVAGAPFEISGSQVAGLLVFSLLCCLGGVNRAPHSRNQLADDVIACGMALSDVDPRG